MGVKDGYLGIVAGNLCHSRFLSPTLRVGKGLGQSQVLGTGSWTSSKVCPCNLRKFFLQGQDTPRTLFWTSAWARGKVRPCYPWRGGRGRPSCLGLVGYILEGPSPLDDQWGLHSPPTVGCKGMCKIMGCKHSLKPEAKLNSKKITAGHKKFIR